MTDINKRGQIVIQAQFISGLLHATLERGNTQIEALKSIEELKKYAMMGVMLEETSIKYDNLPEV
jgi:hypothetical protein